MLANYYRYPVMAPAAVQGLGLGADPEVRTKSVFFGGSSMLRFAIRAGAGYYLGLFFKHPIAGAILGSVFGLPGLFGLALYSAAPASALPNRKRGRRKHRRCRRGGRR
jgi:hypothetical protein